MSESQNHVKEIILKQQPIYKGRIVDLSVVDVQLPDGKTSQREIVKHPGAVAIVALDPDQRVVLVRQYRTAAERILLEIPAGTLNPGEDPLVCAERELQQETGFFPGKLVSLGGIFVAPGYTTEYIHLFVANDLRASRLAADDDEFIEVSHVPLAEALAMIERGEICDGKSVAGLLRVALQYKAG
ncbi:MAG: NUDIX hydrolase [Anaerolineae bacterium]|nr:NUDIX hydrolase [Anaerolineae bacterium]